MINNIFINYKQHAINKILPKAGPEPMTFAVNHALVYLVKNRSALPTELAELDTTYMCYVHFV